MTRLLQGHKNQSNTAIPLAPYHLHRLNTVTAKLGVSRPTLMKWIREGLLKSVMVGREIRISEGELIRFGRAQELKQTDAQEEIETIVNRVREQLTTPR